MVASALCTEHLDHGDAGQALLHRRVQFAQLRAHATPSSLEPGQVAHCQPHGQRQREERDDRQAPVDPEQNRDHRRRHEQRLGRLTERVGDEHLDLGRIQHRACCQVGRAALGEEPLGQSLDVREDAPGQFVEDAVRHNV